MNQKTFSTIRLALGSVLNASDSKLTFLVLVPVLVLTELLGPVVFGLGLNAALTKDEKYTNVIATKISDIIGLKVHIHQSVLIVAFFLFRMLITVYTNKQIYGCTFRFVTRIREKLLETYFYSNERKVTNSIIYREIIHEPMVIANEVILPSIKIALESAIGLILIGLLITFNLDKIPIAFVMFAVSGAYILITKRILSNSSKQISENYNSFSNRVSDLFLSWREIWIYDQFELYSRELASYSRRIGQIYSRIYQLSSLPRYLFEFIVIAIISGYVFLQSHGDSPSDFMSIGLTVFSLGRLFICFVTASNSFSTLHGQIELFQSVQEKTKRTGKPRTDADVLPDRLSFESIEFVGVNFGFGEIPVFGTDLNVKMTDKAAVAIVGDSGSGKSTFTDLLTGLVQPVRGRILVNGHRFDHQLASWHRLISYVPQSPGFLDASILENIVFDGECHNIDREKLHCVTEIADLEPMLESLAGGINYKLINNGSNISGGQRQRIAIARALYKSREILILDESVSALGMSDQRQIIENIVRNFNYKLFICITHNPQLLDMFDIVYDIKTAECREGRHISKSAY